MSDSHSIEGISMVDVLKEQNCLHEHARLVLSGSEDATCTYSQGYLKRQALYACHTCNPPHSSEIRAGVCLACSNTCHPGHDLVEMYTKRNFRCDCGNLKFGYEQRCKLVPEKAATNVDNNYNHNFRGEYCVCNRPYPDPQREEQEDMLQCGICEDWFHVSHLGTPVPSSDEEKSELVCAQCVQHHQFLKNYKELPEDDEDDLENSEEDAESECTMDVAESGAHEGQSIFLPKEDAEIECMMDVAESGADEGQSIFLPDGWRDTLCECNKCPHYLIFSWHLDNLCSCNTCMAMYRSEGVEFLLDPEDTVAWYEAKRDDEDRYNRALQLAGLDRVAHLDAVEEFNRMKDNLKEYLKKFVDNGKMVREEDIREFFDGLLNTKRRRRE